MKVMLLLMILLSVGIFMLVSRAGPVGFFGITPLRDETTYDLDGRAMRQVTIRVHDEEELDIQYSVTIFGRIGDVVEPWTTVSADRDGLELRTIDGSRWRVPVDHEIVVRDAVPGGWRPVRGELPEADLPTLDHGESLLEVLTKKFPEQEGLLRSALPSDPARTESTQGGN